MSIGKTGLGRGFDALIPKSVDAAILFEEHERIQKIALGDIVPNPNQPRTTFEPEALKSLADSIRQHGIVQPLVVTPEGTGRYSIVAGERRWRAAGLAKLDTVPVIVRTTKELERLEIAIVENVQRVDLSPLEQAVSIERLHQQFNMTYETIAKRLGKASSTVNNIVRLLQLPETAMIALRDQKISEGHARAILSLRDMPEKQQELLANILKFSWPVRRAEQYVTSVKEGFKESQATKERMRTETPATKRLSKRLGGTQVFIRRTAKGGKLEIAFKTDEDLERILHTLH